MCVKIATCKWKFRTESENLKKWIMCCNLFVCSREKCLMHQLDVWRDLHSVWCHCHISCTINKQFSFSHPEGFHQFLLAAECVQFNKQVRLMSQKHINLSRKNSFAPPVHSYIHLELTHAAGVVSACGRQKCSMIVFRVCLSSRQKHIYLVSCLWQNVVN